MPRLARIRLVSIGHPRARFDDVTLDLRNRERLADDTVIWMRNGGGKTSLLNLFYSVVRPRQTDFLGGKGGEEHRRLADYVLPDDHAVIALEWELDSSAPDSNGAPLRYITGVFHEHVGSTDAARGRVDTLQRLFFATEVDPSVAELTLEGLPLHTGTSSGQRMRRTMANFRRVWRELRDAHASRDVLATDRQVEWTRQLESRGIDTQLFGYQLDMNAREGGVSELFAFRDQEEFVDFLLKTAFDSQDAERVQEQVQVFRTELERRHRQLQPDEQLCTGLHECLAVFVQLSEERGRARSALASIVRDQVQVQGRLERLQGRLRRRVEELEQDSAARRESACRGKNEAQVEAGRALSLRRHAVEYRLKATQADHQKRQVEMEQARLQLQIWKAAVPLAEALNYEHEARELRRQLRERQTENAPLFQLLTATVSRLAAALSRAAAKLRQEAADARGRASEHQEALKAKRRDAVGQAELAAAAEVGARALTGRLNEAATSKHALLRDGVLARDDEGGDEAVTRLDNDLARLADEETAAATQREDLERQRSEREAQQTRTHIRKAELGGRLETLIAQIGEATAARDALARDPVLLALLQTEVAELDHATGPAVAQATDDARRTFDAILDLRVASADDERSLTHLREYGRLPPSRDVLAILDRLRGRGLRCWSGWEYLEQNVGADQRRSVVETHPHLVAGILLHEGDYEAAAAVGQEGLLLTLPVVVARAEALLQGATSQTYTVWGPTGDGLFDGRAAGRAEQQIEQRLAAARSDIARKDEWHRELLQLVHRLETYRRAYPTGWLREQADQRDQLRSEIDGLEDDAANNAVRIEALSQELRTLATREQERRKRHNRLVEHRHRASGYHEQYGRHLEQWRQEQQGKSEEASSARQRERAIQGEVTQLEGVVEEAGREAAAKQTQAIRLDEEMAQLRHAEEPASDVDETPIDVLRGTYRRLLAEYEQKVGADTLEQLAQQRDQDAERVRRTYERVRDPLIDEARIVRTLEGVVAGESVEECCQRAEDGHWAAKQALGNVASQINRLEERRASLQEDEDRDGLAAFRTVPDVELTPEQAEDEAARAEKRSVVADQQANQDEKQSHELQREAEQTKVQVERADGQARRLATIRQDHEMLVGQASPSEDSETIGTLTDTEDTDALGKAIDVLERSFRSMANQWDGMDKRAAAQMRQVQTLCRDERFAGLQDGVARRFERLDAITLEARAPYFREQLETRLEQIRADLREADRQRDIVVDAVMSAVEQALELLRRVARLSRLPESIRGGGRCFLDIVTHAPENPAERRGRVGELVDEVIASGKLEGGLQLIQRAVRRVARPVQVRVLHPDLDAAGQRVAIPQMANFSGGERLTAAILLYCTLARLRSLQLGLTTRRTSVLVLDNPIGTVSRVKFLDLQREVARAMGIQLIYATGVHDLDAVGTLPNVVRLRNVRRDRRTRHQFVENADGDATPLGSGGVVDAVRIHVKPIPSEVTSNQENGT